MSDVIRIYRGPVTTRVQTETIHLDENVTILVFEVVGQGHGGDQRIATVEVDLREIYDQMAREQQGL